MKLIPGVRELEYGKFKLKFERELEQVKQQAELVTSAIVRRASRVARLSTASI